MAEDRKNRRQSSKDTEQTAPKRMAVSGDLSKTSKEHADNLSEIVKLEEKIAKIARMNFESAKGQALQIKKIAELAQMRNEFLEDTKRIEKNIEDILDEEEKSEKSIVQLTRQRRDNLKDTRNLSDEIAKSIRVANSETKDLSDIGKVVTQNMQATVNFSKEFGNVTERAVNLLQSGVNLSEEFMNKIEETKQVKKEYRDMEFEIATNAEKAAKGQYDAESVQQDLIKKRQKLRAEEEEFIDKTKEFLKNKNKMSKEDQTAKLVELQMEKQILRARNLQLGVFEEQNESLKEASKTAEKTLGVLEKVTSGDFKGALLQKFGLDEINSQLKEKVGGALVNVVNQVKGGDLKGAFSAAASGLGGMIKMAPKLALGLGVAGIAAGIGLLVKSVMHADEEVANLGKEFGISYQEARELHHAAIDISNSMGLTGINAAEVAKAMGEVGEMMGGIDIAAQMKSGNKELTKLVEQTAVLTKQFGMSGEEVGKIHDIATITGTSMDNLVKESVELGKGTMTAKQSLKVLSTIPPQVAVAFKGSTKELIAAAQKAKLLGMELGNVQKIGMGMLEIEDSLGKEMEARVLTGKNLNLDAARMYALQGDTFKLQEEILNQAGSLEDFTKMNTIQQDSMAKALGMSVEEMTKMLTNAEKLKKADISSDYAERLQAMESAADLEKEAANARSKEQKDYILQLAAEKRSTSLKETMASLMEKIKQKFAPIIDAVLEFVGGIKDGTGGVSKFEEIISKIDFNEIAGQIKEFLPKLVEGFGKLMENLPSIIKMITNFVSKLGGAVGPASSILGAINPSIAGFGIMALKIGGPKGVVEGLKLASGGAMKLFDVVKGPLMSGITSLAGGVSGKLGGAFGKVADKAKTGLGSVMEKLGKVKTPEAPKAGGGGFLKGLTDAFKNVNTTDLIKAAVAMLILAAALYVVAKALQEFGSVEWESVAKGGVALLGLVGIGYLLSKVAGDMIVGAAAMVILGAALYVAAKAMQEFSTGVSWEGVLMGIVTLGALVLAVIVLGSLMMSGVGGAAILAGAAALLILSGALWVMGKAMQEFAKAAVIALPFFEALFSFLGPIIQGFAGILMGIADGITTVAVSIANAVGGFMEIAKTDPSKLFTIAGGITAIGIALAALGAGSGGGSIASGLGNLLGGLMGGDSPMEMLTEITKKLEPEKLSATAIAIRELADAFKYFAEETAKLKDFDTDKLETIIEKMEDVKEAQSGGIGGAITGAANAVTGFIGNLSGSPEQQPAQLSEIMTKLDPSKLDGTSKSIRDLADSFKYFAEETGKLKEFDTDKLDSIIERMEKLISFTERMKPEKLGETANGLKALTVTFTSFASALETMAASLDKLNLDKLDAAIEKLEEAKKLNDMSIGEGIASAASSFVGGITSIFGLSEQQSAQPVTAGGGSVAVAAGGAGTNMANVEKKLDTLISVISQAANQPLIIKFGEKTVEEIKTQLNFKKATNIGVDKGYGKTI